MKKLRLVLVAVLILGTVNTAHSASIAYHTGYSNCLSDDNTICWRCAGTPEPTNNCTASFNGASCSNTTSEIKPLYSQYYLGNKQWAICEESGWVVYTTPEEEECEEKETLLWTAANALLEENSPGAIINVPCSDCECTGYAVSASHISGYIYYGAVDVACLPGWYNPRRQGCDGGSCNYLCDECPQNAICPGGYDDPVCAPGYVGNPLIVGCFPCPVTNIYTDSAMTTMAPGNVQLPLVANHFAFDLRQPIFSYGAMNPTHLQTATAMGLVRSSGGTRFERLNSLATPTTEPTMCYVKGLVPYYDEFGKYQFKSDCFYAE